MLAANLHTFVLVLVLYASISCVIFSSQRLCFQVVNSVESGGEVILVRSGFTFMRDLTRRAC